MGDDGWETVKTTKKQKPKGAGRGGGNVRQTGRGDWRGASRGRGRGDWRGSGRGTGRGAGRGDRRGGRGGRREEHGQSGSWVRNQTTTQSPQFQQPRDYQNQFIQQTPTSRVSTQNQGKCIRDVLSSFTLCGFLRVLLCRL